MNLEEGLNLAVKSLRKALGKGFKAERIDAVCIKKEDKKFTRIERKDIDKSIKSLK